MIQGQQTAFLFLVSSYPCGAPVKIAPSALPHVCPSVHLYVLNTEERLIYIIFIQKILSNICRQLQFPLRSYKNNGNFKSRSWSITMRKTVLPKFVHHLSYKITILQPLGSWILFPSSVKNDPRGQRIIIRPLR